MPNTYEQFSAMVFNSPFGDYQRKTIDEVLKMESIGSVIVSWDFSHDKDKDILIVGKQEHGKVEIINAIQGPEAYALWKKLTIKNKK